MSPFSSRIIKYFFLAIAVGVAGVAFIVLGYSGPRYTTVTVLNVGQGDAILITTPSGQRVLIDGGPDLAVLEGLGRHLPFYERTIDLLVLTHPDADHLTGLIEVMRRYTIGAVLHTGVAYDSAGYRHFQSELIRRGIPVIDPGFLDTIQLSDGLRFEVLYPQQSIAGQSIKYSNESSIVLRLIDNHFRVLLTGDTTIAIEKIFLTSGVDVVADVLKVGHHGSDTSTGEGFLNAVDPTLAVISVGVDNKFGHPSPRVLDRLVGFSISVIRTDQVGDIIIQSDGQRYWLH